MDTFERKMSWAWAWWAWWWGRPSPCSSSSSSSSSTFSGGLEDLLNFPAPHIHDRILGHLDFQSKLRLSGASKRCRALATEAMETPEARREERRNNWATVERPLRIRLRSGLNWDEDDFRAVVPDHCGGGGGDHQIFLVSPKAVRLFRNFKFVREVKLAWTMHMVKADHVLLWANQEHLFVLRSCDTRRGAYDLSEQRPLFCLSQVRRSDPFRVEKEERLHLDARVVASVLRDRRRQAQPDCPVRYVRRQAARDVAPAMHRLAGLVARRRREGGGGGRGWRHVASNEELCVFARPGACGASLETRVIDSGRRLWGKNTTCSSRAVCLGRAHLLAYGERSGDWVVLRLRDGAVVRKGRLRSQAIFSAPTVVSMEGEEEGEAFAMCYGKLRTSDYEVDVVVVGGKGGGVGGIGAVRQVHLQSCPLGEPYGLQVRGQVLLCRGHRWWPQLYAFDLSAEAKGRARRRVLLDAGKGKVLNLCAVSEDGLVVFDASKGRGRYYFLLANRSRDMYARLKEKEED